MRICGFQAHVQRSPVPADQRCRRCRGLGGEKWTGIVWTFLFPQRILAIGHVILFLTTHRIDHTSWSVTYLTTPVRRGPRGLKGKIIIYPDINDSITDYLAMSDADTTGGGFVPMGNTRSQQTKDIRVPPSLP